MRRRVEESRLSGRKPVPPQLIGKAELLNDATKTIRLADESDVFKGKTEIEEEEDEKEKKDASRKGPIFVFNRDAEKAAAKNPATPRLRRATRITTSVPFPAARGRTQPEAG